MLHPEINRQHQIKHTFLLKNNKTGDIKKLTPVTSHKSVRFSLTNDSKGSKQETMKDKPMEDLINLVQSDEIPHLHRDSSETEPKLPFTNDNGAANFIK